MEKSLKAKLLERKFSSVEYMEAMREHHQASIDAMVEAIQYFYAHPPQGENWHNWNLADKPETWEGRAFTNFRGTQQSICDGIVNARKGQLSTIRGASGSLHSIFRNLDNMGWKWWDYTDPVLKARFRSHLVAARDRATNIYLTTADYWRPGEILDEEIVGPIDEQDLLRYLKPGETP